MTTTHAHHDPIIPRPALLSAAALVLLAVALSAWVRWSGQEIRPPDAPATVERLLHFTDQPDGSVAVIDAATRQEFRRITGEAGFLRGTVRGMTRERKRMGIGDQPPFRLAVQTDGRLTLQDPATGRRVDLGSFGPTNAAVFAQLLPATTR